MKQQPSHGIRQEAGPVFHELRGKFPRIVRDGWQEPPLEVVVIEKDSIARVAGYLRESWGVAALMDLTVVDYQGYAGGKKPARFEVVWYFQSFESGRRIRIKAAVPDTDPVVPSLSGLYASADWLEREAWDMFGIGFTGHPGLRRILMYEEFSGHPLRKDYPLAKEQPLVEQVHPGVPPFGAKPKALGGE